MHQMYLEYGRLGNLYKLQGIIDIVNNVSGSDCLTFFARYVEGIEEIPLRKYLEYCGLEISKEVVELLPSRS